MFSEIGTRIDDFLKASGMNQVELAKLIGVSQEVMEKIIHGKKAVNLAEIGRIADVLNISVDNLIPQEKAMETSEPISLMMASIEKANTADELRFLDHVMDEMIALDELLKQEVE